MLDVSSAVHSEDFHWLTIVGCCNAQLIPSCCWRNQCHVMHSPISIGACILQIILTKPKIGVTSSLTRSMCPRHRHIIGKSSARWGMPWTVDGRSVWQQGLASHTMRATSWDGTRARSLVVWNQSRSGPGWTSRHIQTSCWCLWWRTRLRNSCSLLCKDTGGMIFLLVVTHN